MFKIKSLTVAAAVAFTLVGAPFMTATNSVAADKSEMTAVVPDIDAARGRVLFTEKRCVLCHSINDVGGRLGPALDAYEDQAQVDVLDFVARMWRGAFAMIEFQAVELSYQVDLEGDELGDLAAFAGNKAEQQKFSEDDIPELVRDWIVKEPYDIEDYDFD